MIRKKVSAILSPEIQLKKTNQAGTSGVEGKRKKPSGSCEAQTANNLPKPELAKKEEDAKKKPVTTSVEEPKKKPAATSVEDAKKKPAKPSQPGKQQEGDGIMKKMFGRFKGKGKSKNLKNRTNEGDKSTIGEAPSKAPSKQMDVKPKQETSKPEMDEKKEDKKGEDEKKEDKKGEGEKKEDKKGEDEKKEDKKDEDEKKDGEKKEKMSLVELYEGDVLMGQRNIGWKIVRELGKGGFGKVYEVYNETVRGGTHLACKTEPKNEAVGMKTRLRLKIEIDALLAIYKSKKDKVRHFVELIDYGKDKERGLKYIVMTMLGPSLCDLRKKIFDNKDFPRPTGIFVAQQTFEALQHFHEIGFIHRDVKPQNYAVGREAYETTIYLYDFGLSRRLYESDGKTHRKPRENGKVRFCGTLRYASVRAHEKCEQSRKDDIESWIYMIYDLFDHEKGLRWKQCSTGENQRLLEMKKKFIGLLDCSPEEKVLYCSAMVPDGFEEFKEFVRQLEFESQPPYKKFEETMSKAATLYKVAANKCEWVGLNFDAAKEEKQQEPSNGVQQQGSINL